MLLTMMMGVMMMMMTTNYDNWWWWQLMMVMVGTSGVMQRLQCHGRKRSSQLFTRETETDGYNYHMFPHQMKMLMIIIFCCIVTTTSIITKVKVASSHVLVMSRTQGSNLHICYCAPFPYCNWNGRNISFIFEQIVSWQKWSAMHPIIIIFGRNMLSSGRVRLPRKEAPFPK